MHFAMPAPGTAVQSCSAVLHEAGHKFCSCPKLAVQVPKQLYSLEDLRMNKIQPEALLAPTDDTLGKIRTGLQVYPTHVHCGKHYVACDGLAALIAATWTQSEHRLAILAFYAPACLHEGYGSCPTLGRISAKQHA